MAITTKDQATQSIEQIQTGVNYTANQLRPLLLNLLDSIYNPFRSGPRDPNTTTNQVIGYRAGSLGKNTATGRYFVCTASDATTATWEQLTNDTGYQQINASASTAYQISTSTSIVSFTGSQNTVTVNLPIAANSYVGKVVRIYFTSPASASGLGLTFAVPEAIPLTLLAPNLYTSHAFVEFTYTASGWALTQYVPTVPSFGFQTLFPVNGGTGAVLSNTYLVNLSLLIPAVTATYNLTLPANPYIGKVVKIQASSSVTSITTLTVRRSDATTLASGAISANQAVEFIYNGTDWIKVAPTIIWP